MSCPNQKFPVLINGKTLIVTANFIPERATESSSDGKNIISFEQSGKIEWKLMDSLVHQFTGNSESLNADTCVNKIRAAGIMNDVFQMIGIPKIVIVKNGNEVALGRFDPAIQSGRARARTIQFEMTQSAKILAHFLDHR